MPLFWLLAVSLGCKGRGEATWWGPERAADLDEANDVVEVKLRANQGEVDYGIGAGTVAWLYNGQAPGPAIGANVGDTLTVHLDNDLPYDTTVHWHGMRVPNAMDGVGWLQDPVGPGESFTYSFTIPDAGTWWYHPHMMSTEAVERGLQGAIIAEDPDDPPVDVERLLMLDDIDLTPEGEIAPFELDESEINTRLGRLGNVLLLNGQSFLDGPVRATAEGGTVERWRLVNTANARTMEFSLEGAAFRVIAEDGTMIDPPQEVQTFTLAAGQRADLEVLPAEQNISLTLLLQSPAGEQLPYEALSVAVDHPDTAAEPLDWPAPELAEIVSTTQSVQLVLDSDDEGLAVSWTINGEAWTSCEDALGGDPIPVAQDTPTELTLVNNSDEDHPFHLHGQLMQLLDRDGVAPDYRGQRDTVLLRGGETVRLFSRFENPGVWMAHCHILEHAAMGMMTAFEVAP